MAEKTISLSQSIISGFLAPDIEVNEQKDLLFHPDRWDTWYALGQTYTLESENALAWTADRIEKDRKTIARYQRVHLPMIRI